MEHVTISKEKLLSRLKENRGNHRAIFEDALQGWKEQVLKALAQATEDARRGINYETFINLPRPNDHTKDYDEVIDRVEWHEEDTIDLELHEFNQFIRDDWSWMPDFTASTSSYSSSSSISSKS